MHGSAFSTLYIVERQRDRLFSQYPRGCAISEALARHLMSANPEAAWSGCSFRPSSHIFHLCCAHKS